MSIIEAAILGVVQGLSEFLPISSSGHLLIVPWLFGWEDLDPSTKKAFDVALHIGTLIAVVGYFRRDLVVYVREGLKVLVRRGEPASTEGRLAWLLLLSTVPAAAVGALFEDWIDTSLGTPLIIAISLIVFGLVIWVIDRRAGSRPLEEFTARDALIVGSAQVLALNPGTSRSGITISAGRVLNFSRDAAARISFLMSIPVILGAVVLKVGGLVADGVPEDLIVPMLVGIVTAGLSGWVAVWGTLRWVRSRTFLPFVIYRIALGVLILVLLASGVR